MTSDVPGRDGPPQGKQPSSDLWSVPPGAMELDDAALWGKGDFVDRLSAVLPEVAHPESESESALPGETPGRRTETRQTRGAADAATREPGRRPRLAMVVAILVVSFCGAVLVGTFFPPPLLVPSLRVPNESSAPAGPALDPRPVTNGPSECPMYAAPPVGPNVAPGAQSGVCFFVG